MHKVVSKTCAQISPSHASWAKSSSQLNKTLIYALQKRLIGPVKYNLTRHYFLFFSSYRCDGLAKISDPTERRDAYQGFVVAVHANPQAIQTASQNLSDTLTAIIFAIISWHIPSDAIPVADLLHNSDTSNKLQPFPPGETELANALGKLMHDLKNSVPKEVWDQVNSDMPVNVRQLLREVYQL